MEKIALTNTTEIYRNARKALLNKTVAVLMATYNGIRWLPEQVDSILKQTEVNVRLYISDDLSTDGTWGWLQSLAAKDGRVVLLPQGKFGRAAANFYRLILDAEISGCDYVAFSDQDDIWVQDKLCRQINIISGGKYEGVSSDVTAFWEDGRSTKIVKSQAQREFDYIFEAAGPGCTYLMTPWLVGELRKLIADPFSCASDVALHDWLTYAVCRASGGRWHIDDVPTVWYRQHDANEVGANHGLAAKLSRLRRLKSGWYRLEVLKILHVCTRLKPCNPELGELQRAICAKGAYKQIGLMRYVNKARRKLTDRIAFSVTVFLVLF